MSAHCEHNSVLSNYAELSQMLRISHAVILRALSTTALGRLNGYGSWNRFSSLSVLDQADGPADGSFGDDMADQEAVGTAGESAVGD